MTGFRKYKRLPKSTHWLLCLFMILFFAACGGGGGGGGGDTGGSSDGGGSSGTADTTAPVIILNGEDTITLTQGDTYNELGATATDDRDGSVDVVISGTVDNSTLGSYILTYTASDSAGNISNVTRSVEVVLPADITAPVITLIGESEITLFLGGSYEELGATATDDRDGVVTVATSGSVDTNAAGIYTITYSATDSSGNASSLIRSVTVDQFIPFITTWKTDNSGFSNDNQIIIGTSGSGYDYQIDWGDGLSDSNVTGDITHTYDTAGTYTVTISGDFPRIFFDRQTEGYDNLKILTIEQWGSQQWQSMNRAFYRCSYLTSNALDAPDLSQVTDMNRMFYRASAFNQDLSSWNVASVTDMSLMFGLADSFNQDLSSWNVALVTDMSWMFSLAYTFNQDLSSWDVASVTDMSGMFYYAQGFNQDLNTWNVASVTDMSWMFAGAKTFNQDLSSWNVALVTNMKEMFSRGDIVYDVVTFNQDLSSWNVASVTDMRNMFKGASAFNQDLSSWNVASATDMSGMFAGTSINQDLSSWNVASVTDMSGMFAGTSAFNQDLSSWNVISVTDMSLMFHNTSVFNQDLSSWEVVSVTDMSRMFHDASAFNQDLSSWNVASVSDMSGMFDNITLSTANYDALLSGWSVQTLQNDVVFSGGNSTYPASSQGARDTLTNVYNWTVTDGGVAP